MTKQYSNIDFSVPKNVQEAAKKGIELHEQYHRGGTNVGMETAHILSKGGQVEPDKVKHIAAYFPRHEANDNLKQDGSDGSPPSNGYIAYLLWGGKPGHNWSDKLVKEMEKSDKDSAK